MNVVKLVVGILGYILLVLFYLIAALGLPIAVVLVIIHFAVKYW